MSFIISGIQQVGIGIPDVKAAWAWYRKYFGMDIPVFQEEAEAPLMTRYTGGEVQSRNAVMALNMGGGAGMEIWQYTSRNTEPPSFEVQLGDYGIFATRIKSKNVEDAYTWFKEKNLDVLGEPLPDPRGNKHFFLRDPYGMLFEIVQGNSWFSTPKHITGGPSGCMIGVSDVENSLTLYRDLLGYDEIVYDESGAFADLAGLSDNKGTRVRRVLLRHSKPRVGGFSRLLGPSEIELIKVYDRVPNRIFKDRFWGDLGFIHLCFDVRNMDALEKACEEQGYPFTVDSMSSFDMGEAAGRFSYIEDPDGTLIEFVEAHKMPIVKKWGWYLNLKKRPDEKPLPNWMLKALKFSRVKD